MKIETTQWLPLKVAAQYAGVSEMAIVNWYLAGQLTAVDPWNRERLYSVGDIKKINKARKQLKATRGKTAC
jgi:predicted site-specific integrase-resolvase